MSFLSSEQETKKCFLQLGRTFGLSLDILRLLYNYKNASEKEEEGFTRMFYKNMILLMCLDSHGNLDVFTTRCVSPFHGRRPLSMTDTKLSIPIQSWLRTYQYMSTDMRFMKEDLYSHRLPLNKNCEWGIKHSGLSERKPLKLGEDVRGFYDSREKLLAEIRIFGEEGYLTSRTARWTARGRSFVNVMCPPPTRRHKILYLNSSPWEEVEMDHENFLEWKGTEHESRWRIIIDEFGEGSFL
jgi:hypothetical protein